MALMQRSQDVSTAALPGERSCSEGGCDRVAARSDARCSLHAKRLGSIPVQEPEVQALSPGQLEALRAREKARTVAASPSATDDKASVAEPVPASERTALPERWWRWAASTFAATGAFWISYFAYLATFQLIFRDAGPWLLHGLSLGGVALAAVASPVSAGVAFYRANTRTENILSWVLTVAAVLTFFTGLYVCAERLNRPFEPLLVPDFHQNIGQ